MPRLLRPTSRSIVDGQPVMYSLFVHVERSISRLMIGHFSHLPGAPDPASIVDVGISNHR